ncbi:MAG: prepilin-type N-terminal cleavage/methylation domain-containing protein [Patescibacteria group bacterium]|nr:prepilin-type N-terminal cleavage/methylation domain-containing protein [Patescibacteria group bacterium]
MKFSKNGLTLIEVLIYSALLAIFLIGSFLFINSILSVDKASEEQNEALANQDFVEAKLNWLLGQTTNINTPPANASSTELKLDGSTIGIFPAVFSLANNAINLSLNNGSVIPVTNDRVKVTTFAIEHFSNNQSFSSIRITLALESNISPNIKTSSTIFYVIK